MTDEAKTRVVYRMLEMTAPPDWRSRAESAEKRLAEVEAERDRLRDVLQSTLDHVEDPNVARILNQCTLCYSYRKAIRDVLETAANKADQRE